MAKMIFVNLPVRDVAASTAFYAALGFTQDQRFSNHQASAMQWSDTISFMLLSNDFFRTFTDKAIADARTTAQALLCLSADSRDEVDAMLDKALAAGGTAHPLDPKEATDFMYGRSFEDPDGHGIELMWMDVAAFEAATQPHQPVAA